MKIFTSPKYLNYDKIVYKKRSSISKKHTTKVKNLTQPTLVRWSNLYLGRPPLIKISKAIDIKNFIAIITDPTLKVSKKLVVESSIIPLILRSELSIKRCSFKKPNDIFWTLIQLNALLNCSNNFIIFLIRQLKPLFF